MSKISTNNVAKAVFEGLKQKPDLKVFAQNLEKFLVKKKMLPQANIILDKVSRLYDADSGVVKAKLITAQDLAAQDRSQIIDVLKSRYGVGEVVLEEVVDPSLIGGFRVEVFDEVLDVSILNKLKKLQIKLTR